MWTRPGPEGSPDPSHYKGLQGSVVERSPAGLVVGDLRNRDLLGCGLSSCSPFTLDSTETTGGTRGIYATEKSLTLLPQATVAQTVCVSVCVWGGGQMIRDVLVRKNIELEPGYL